jgi:hypothetical protein
MGGHVIAAMGGVLCAGIGFGQFSLSNRQIQASSTAELLEARCDPEISRGFAEIVAYRQRLCASAKMRGDRCDWHDRWAADFWFSVNKRVLRDVFDVDGDGRLSRDEMEKGLKAWGATPQQSRLLSARFFEGVKEGENVATHARIKALESHWNEARNIDAHALRLRGLFRRLEAQVCLGMITRRQAQFVPGRDFARRFVKYVEPLCFAKSLRVYSDAWTPESDRLFDFCRDLYRIDDLPEPQHRPDLRLAAALTPEEATELIHGQGDEVVHRAEIA